MSREEFATLLYWNWVIWGLTILNPCFMLPQLVRLWRTRKTEAISIATLIILLVIQWGFSLHGFFIRDNPLFITNGLAGLTTLATLFSALYIRRA